MESAVIWHDCECGHYCDDLPLWRTLADACGGSILDIGAGSGRVALDLAAGGHDVTAVDHDRTLIAELGRRASARGLNVRSVTADARQIDTCDGVLAGSPFSLAIVPMQTIQLLGGRSGRRAFLRAVRSLLVPGGLLAVALAEALEAFDGVADGLPSADVLVVDGRRHVSQTLAIVDRGEQAVIDRLRTIDGVPGVEHDRVALDRLGAHELQREMLMLGYRRKPMRKIESGGDYVDSTVVIAGA